MLDEKRIIESRKNECISNLVIVLLSLLLWVFQFKLFFENIHVLVNPNALFLTTNYYLTISYKDLSQESSGEAFAPPPGAS